ncbi:hypothetical protein B0H11DRAFT_2229084 [Mycena galericulata]|nr:hypothetical protein B0H11DRAFT_2229084 [Mycena galericulata]
MASQWRDELAEQQEKLERDLDLERRKVRDLQDAARESDKEYQKLEVRSPEVDYLFFTVAVLQTQYDKIKRKALLAPASGTSGDDPRSKFHTFTNTINIGAVVGGIETNGASLSSTLPSGPPAITLGWGTSTTCSFPWRRHPIINSGTFSI